jgi:glycosyltransferase involved in cell wall biosynthesis
MRNRVLIPSTVSRAVIMTGVYYEKNHPGGISAVIQYWSRYIEGLQYYPEYKEGTRLVQWYWYIATYLRLFFRFAFDRRIKILHCHTAAGYDFIRTSSFVRLAKVFGKKVIIHSHASRFKDYYMQSGDERKKKICKILNSADVLIVLSESWREWFVGVGVESSIITVLHNITEYPTVIDNIDSKGIKKNFLFLGEIGPRKGVFDLLEAIALHKDVLRNRMELRIGGNKMEEKLKAFLIDNELEDFVFFEGFVTGNRKIELLNWADIYILPSFNEGLPISILEAMSYSMPIISTPVGGIPEVVNDNNGVLVSPGNCDEIFAALIKYLDNPDLISIHGEESRKKAEAYLPDNVMRDLLVIYTKLLS